MPMWLLMHPSFLSRHCHCHPILIRLILLARRRRLVVWLEPPLPAIARRSVLKERRAL